MAFTSSTSRATKRQRSSESLSPQRSKQIRKIAENDDDEIDTDTKLAILQSLHPATSLEELLSLLLDAGGSIERASSHLSAFYDASTHAIPAPASSAPRQQTALTSYLRHPSASASASSSVRPPAKGRTLHLYTPSLAVQHSLPLTLHTSFFSASLASSLLTELLSAASAFPPPATFTLFDRRVQSPHTFGLFIRHTSAEATEKAKRYSYQARTTEPHRFTSSMHVATEMVEKAVNEYLSSDLAVARSGRWETNVALVNCYRGGAQSVGWHADELTYLGPLAVIASVSLGVEREFRIRRKPTKEMEEREGEGQYSIHLPHNSLVIMHQGMQEDWKHCIHPARTVEKHPVAGEARINITYRWYKDSLAPEKTPRCGCDLPMVLRSARRKDGEKRRYLWQCTGGYRDGKPGGEDQSGCEEVRNAVFDENWEPVWEGDAGEGATER